MSRSSSATPVLDEETRQMVIKKTWCHGQLVAPLYSVVLLWWNVTGSPERSTLLWLPIIYFPCWCYWSYKNVFDDFSIQQLLVGGILAEICHAIVLAVAVRAGVHESTSNMIVSIVASLFLVETAAFLCAATALRPRNRHSGPNATFYQDKQRTSPQPLV